MARPSLDATQILEQRSRLVAAALSLYRAQGYEAVTLRSLAAQLDISHATPYRYFKSKDELFAAIRTEVWAHFSDHLERAGRGKAQPITRLRNICLAVVDFAWQFPEDYRLIFSLRQPPATEYPELQEARMRTASFVVSVCQEAIDAGQLEGDAMVWAHIAWASIHGLVNLHVANQLALGLDIEHVVEPLLQVLLPGGGKPKRSRPLRTHA